MTAKKSESHTGRNIAIGCAVVAGIAVVAGPVLLAIILIAVNPAKQFAQANDTKRHNDSLQVLNAVWQYAAEHNEALPPSLTETPTEVATICSDLVPQYMTGLPVDPAVGENDVTDCTMATSTGYMIYLAPNGKVVVTAPEAELEEIMVSR